MLKIPQRVYYNILIGFMCFPYTLIPVRWNVHFDKSIFNIERIIYKACLLEEKSISMEILSLVITIDI
jgi:hypothetical protein